MSPSAPSAKSPAPSQPVTSSQPTENNSQDVLVRLWMRFGRFGWDALGVLLLSIALLTVLGLSGLTQGSVISPWVHSLRVALGWGSPLFVVALSVIGMVCLRRHFARWPAIPLGRILALEGAAFAVLTLFSEVGGRSLEQAEAGQDGGVIGWGLAEILERILPSPWSPILTAVLLIFFGAYGLGFLQWALRTLETWLDGLEQNRLNAPAEKRPAPASAAASLAVENSPAADPLAAAQPAVRDPRLPPLSILMEELAAVPDETQIRDTGLQIEKTLAEFGIPARVIGYRVGPTITQFAVEPGFNEKTGPDGEVMQQKVRVAQISALSRDLALALKAERLRIEAPVPGRSYVGIEVPNPNNSLVRLRAVMEGEAFNRLKTPLAVALGKDVAGLPLVADLGRMPHLLIAGTTGSGKSVCIAALVTCLAVNNPPDRLRMALMDPKMVELARFNGLPHLLGKVETEIERMLGVLHWALAEMDQRYRLLENAHTRDLETFNRKAEKRGQPTLPRVVIIIDELADLMMSAPDQTEPSLVRLAQMARAVGMHLVVATQRPSTDVVTGLIKANFPARLAFSVASSIDSRVILDTNGAESLLGHGDMLFLNPEVGSPLRAQGVLVSDQEVERVVSYWQKQAPLTDEPAPPWEEMIQKAASDEGDSLVEQAIQVVKQTQRASASLLQRRLRIGYPRAARLIDELEEMGVVGPSQGSGKDREVLMDPDEELDSEDDLDTPA